MRGFLGGVSAGALLAAGGLAMLSLSVPLPQTAVKPDPAPEPAGQTAGIAPEQAGTEAAEAPQPVAQEAAEVPQMPNGGGEDAAVSVSSQRDADLAEVQPEAPGADAAGDDLSALAGADTSPADQPAVGLATAMQGADKLGPAKAPEPVIPAAEHQPQSALPAAPQAPGSESVIVAATEPAAAPQEGSGTNELASGGAPAQENTPSIAEAPVSSSVQVPDIGSAPAEITLPVIGAASGTPAAAGSSDTGEGGEHVADTETAEPAPLTPSIGTLVVPLTERDKHEAASAGISGAPVANPFSANAEPFLNPEDRPLMSIVLIDDAGAIGAEALADFPYPLSFAIDPEDPEAAAKMAERRKAGFEVLMLADLPREATPQDAETSFEVWRGKLPEAVAILEGVETGVQGNRPLADQVAAVAASAGYGLVTQDSGLNTVQKLALRDGVPAGVVFRDFDGAGQDPRAIRRFLDQAAFRAGQEGAVIMLGRLRPDTISALLLWGLQDRAERVALAPVSASLDSLLPGK
ncbi:divergent polysaccharide deacetylase family protein [Leisingera sp. S132]|uniref:polysaccharide deacteylase family 2 protein n=1 Tax=Leisingera sp. S132 TaxID=2867016 RepID=UPI0021A4B625|nr:polysaccharide deacteylase family 2 protein [Leisingera sp. S132]UWQ81056.1 divergent polysaccharide deacetylase family protein [Leisingera sp. S132]